MSRNQRTDRESAHPNRERRTTDSVCFGVGVVVCAGVCLGRMGRVWAWAGVWACSSKFFEKIRFSLSVFFFFQFLVFSFFFFFFGFRFLVLGFGFLVFGFQIPVFSFEFSVKSLK